MAGAGTGTGVFYARLLQESMQNPSPVLQGVAGAAGQQRAASIPITGLNSNQ